MHALTLLPQCLPNQPAARKSFVQSRGLQRVLVSCRCIFLAHRHWQELESNQELQLQEYVEAIKGCFPAKVVQYYAPNYGDTLLQELDQGA